MAIETPEWMNRSGPFAASLTPKGSEPMAEETHNIIWAANKLRAGFKVRRKASPSGWFMFLAYGCVRFNPESLHLSANDLLADDWEIDHDLDKEDCHDED